MKMRVKERKRKSVQIEEFKNKNYEQYTKEEKAKVNVSQREIVYLMILGSLVLVLFVMTIIVFVMYL